MDCVARKRPKHGYAKTARWKAAVLALRSVSRSWASCLGKAKCLRWQKPTRMRPISICNTRSSVRGDRVDSVSWQRIWLPYLGRFVTSTSVSRNSELERVSKWNPDYAGECKVRAQD